MSAASPPVPGADPVPTRANGIVGRIRESSRLAVEAYLWATSPLRSLPDYLIIGAQRCGTTSLLRYLVRHPAVVPTLLSKGVHFFDTNYGKGAGWYRGHFPAVAYRRSLELLR